MPNVLPRPYKYLKEMPKATKRTQPKRPFSYIFLGAVQVKLRGCTLGVVAKVWGDHGYVGPYMRRLYWGSMVLLFFRVRQEVLGWLPLQVG